MRVWHARSSGVGSREKRFPGRLEGDQVHKGWDSPVERLLQCNECAAQLEVLLKQAPSGDCRADADSLRV